MILAALRDLAKALGCRDDQAEEVMRDETSARATLSRRALLGASVAAVGAVAAGKLLSVGGVGLDGYEFRMGALPRLAVACPRALTTFDAIMKEIYSSAAIVEKLNLGELPFYAMLQKDRSFTP